MQKYINNVQDTNGKAIVGAAITVNLAATGLPATLYSDNGVTLTTNPIYSSTTGSFAFYAADGRYNIVVTYGTNTISTTDILLEDPANPTAIAATTLTASGLVTAGAGTALGGATNPIIAQTTPANNYVQSYVYNQTAGTSSSSDFVAYTDNSSDAHGWADMGFTASAYADATYTVTGANEAYLFGSAPTASGKTGNLVIATDNTGTANAIQMYVGGFTQAKTAYKFQIDSLGNIYQKPPTTPPALTVNGDMVFNLTSNTNLRISVRGSDGVTRVANITLV